MTVGDGKLQGGSSSGTRGAKWWDDEDEGRWLHFKLVPITSIMAIWCPSKVTATRVYFLLALDWKNPPGKEAKV